MLSSRRKQKKVRWLAALSLTWMTLWVTPEPAMGAGDAGEVDISDVQNQYWKSHDRDFEVIQNRKYTKKYRLEVSPLAGLYQRVDFQETTTLGGALAFHFSEIFGIEVMSYKTFARDSDMLVRFQETKDATIPYNKERFYLGVSALFTPIYAKFSFLGRKISHFDFYVSPGVGVVKTMSLRPTVSLGVGQKFWLNPRFNIRAEYKWMRYSDTVTGASGLVDQYTQGVNDYNLLLGFSFLF